ncbi:MAG TPA: hypothetical protein VFN67_12730 [Polyangiales bacterium]|nr:hypothetical protein [Polyangiales bacterium]
MTIYRAFTWAVMALGVAALSAGCEYECPSGSVRNGGACMVASSTHPDESEPNGEETHTKDGGSEQESKPDAGASEPEPQPDNQPAGGAGGMSGRAADGGKGGGGPTKPKVKPPEPTAGGGGQAMMMGEAGHEPEAGHSAGEEAGAGGSPAPATKFESRGGPVLKHPDVILLFWGAAWTTSQQVTPGQVGGALQHMLAGPYYANLNQYGELAYPSLNWISIDASTPVPDHAPSADEVKRYINARLEAGTAPAVGGDQIYVVVLPPGALPNGSLGERGKGGFKGTSYRYAWVASSQSVNDAHSATYSITRHVIHSMSNPEGDGWLEADSGKELVDVCGWTTISGVAHPQYWSNAEGRCVVPREYGLLLRYDGKPNAWTPIWKNVRMATCGGFGLVATDATDNIFKFNGQPDNWTQIGLQGAQHVVGPDTVYGLTPDLSAIFQYTGTGTSWVRIGSQSINMYVGGFGVFATEIGSNNLKKWSGSGTEWTDYGGPGSSFAVGADFIAGASPDHSGVFRSTASINWAQIKTTGVNMLYSSGTSRHLAATDRGDADAIFIYREDTTWARQGFPGYTFVLTSEDLFGLAPNRWGLFQSNDLSATSPDFTQIAGTLHNVVTGCDTSLYALSGLVQCDEGTTGMAGSTCANVIGP